MSGQRRIVLARILERAGGGPIPPQGAVALRRLARNVYRAAVVRVVASFLIVLSSLPLSVMLPPGA